MRRKSEPSILLEDYSPICDVHAYVEESGDCVYFYLWFYPDSERSFGKSCWVCNTAPAPDDLDSEAMGTGRAPMMPARFCKEPLQGITLDPARLSIVWFEEGDGAALLDEGHLLAVIPGWAGEHFPGYSRHATGTGGLAWELDQAEPTLHARVKKSRAYWEAMEGDYWKPMQGTSLAALEAFFGPYQKYYAIDGGHFPPKALVTGAREGIRYACTIGVSALSQPGVEGYHQENTPHFRRIELGFACGVDWPEESWTRILSYLSAQANLPWSELAWLGDGHTIPCDQIEGFPVTLLLNAAEHTGLFSPVLPSFQGERVNLLWLVPLTQAEYTWVTAQEESSSRALLARYGGNFQSLAVFDGHPKFGV